MPMDPRKWTAKTAAPLGLVWVLIAAAAVPSRAGKEAPRVVVSVKPVHSLVAGVMKGVAVPRLLVRGAASPHTYSLRPSDARALWRADVVIWVGEVFETFLRKPLKALSARARVVEISRAEGLIRFAVRKGGIGGGRGKPGRLDPHVWLDPVNARAMVRAIVKALSLADPRHAARYAENGRALNRRLRALDGEIRARLRRVAATPYIVFHDAYRYFENRYGLNVVGSLTVSPERRPGARRLSEIRAKVRRLGVACVFAEPQFRPSLVRTVAEGAGVKTAVLDPLGAGLDAGPELYFSLMRRLADSLVRCLSRN